MHSHPNKEDSLRKQLEIKGIDFYYPTIQVQPVNPRARKRKAYFPGYIFISLDLKSSSLSELQWLPYSAGLVSFGGEPAQVPENLIHALKKRLVENAAEISESKMRLKQGDQVVIKNGPFDGFEGIFQAHLSGTDRVQILLRMLSNQSVPLDLPDGQVYLKNQVG